MASEATGGLLVASLNAIRRIKPRLHVFGHIHEDYGVTMEGPTTLVNASTCTLNYKPANLPQVITLA